MIQIHIEQVILFGDWGRGGMGWVMSMNSYPGVYVGGITS